MNERTVTITLDEYRELVQKSERIATVDRLFKNGDYVTVTEVKKILGLFVEVKAAKTDEVKNGVL